MNLYFYGGANKVTGSCYVLEVSNKKILIDCGYEQDNTEIKKIREKINILPQIDVCFITHAHIDHVGLLPLAVKKKKINNIYSTPATKELSKMLLSDMIKIQKENENKKENILYDETDLEDTLLLWKTIDENNPINIENNLISTFLYNAHIIGSASVYIQTSEGSFLFTGDLGTKCQKLMDSHIDIPENKEVDYLIIETTYGNKLHNISDRDRLISIIEKICNNKGKILIPVFAVGRLQEILYTISQKQIPWPVYVDTPLGDKVNNLLNEYQLYLSKSIRKKQDSILGKYKIINTMNQSKELANSKEPCIILSASGMIQGGRILNHIETIKNDPNSAIIFVGYQAEGTRGRKIYNKEEYVSCQIEKLSCFSAHADKEEIINYIDRFTSYPYKIFLVHGEEEQRKAIQKEIRKKRIRVEIPENFNKISNFEFNNTKKYIINIPLNFCTLKNNKISPCIGYIIDRDDTYEIVPKEWIDNLFEQERKEIMNKIEKDIYKEEITEQLSPTMDIETIKKNISELFRVKVYTKKRMTEFLKEAEKGQKAGLLYIENTHKINKNTGRRKWQTPQNEDGSLFPKEKAEEYYELAYNTAKSLLAMGINTAFKILGEYIF